ncbi:MAG TPA: flagellar basal body-associated FliL family protein [Acidimicrobiia bacterium]|nr:flagellar basal body-associated FliL family protein [Acidimicrobiia bacterium]
MAEESAQPEAQPAPEKSGGRGKLVIVLVVVLVLAGGAGAAWWFGLLPGRRAEAKQEVKEPEPKVGALLPLDPFIANLADEDGKRYLKATIQLEFFSSKVPEEFTARNAQVRDLLLTLFTSKQYVEIRTPQGKSVLRDEIINRVNRALNHDVVKAVYFTEFIVQ